MHCSCCLEQIPGQLIVPLMVLAVAAALNFSYYICRSVYLLWSNIINLRNIFDPAAVGFHEQQRYPVLFVAQEGPRKTVNNIEEPLLAGSKAAKDDGNNNNNASLSRTRIK